MIHLPRGSYILSDVTKWWKVAIVSNGCHRHHRGVLLISCTPVPHSISPLCILPCTTYAQPCPIIADNLHKALRRHPSTAAPRKMEGNNPAQHGRSESRPHVSPVKSPSGSVPARLPATTAARSTERVYSMNLSTNAAAWPPNAPPMN